MNCITSWNLIRADGNGEKMKIAIIGGGACGMMAAIAAAEQKASVTVFEKNNKAGKKILATGNGKCNFSNLDFHIRI